MNNVAKRMKEYQEKLAQYRQQHLLAFWDDLEKEQRTLLLDDLDQIDFARCAPLVDTFVRNAPEFHMPASLEPPATYPAVPAADQQDHYQTAREIGAAALRKGKVAAFTVAGGQGTRLGYDGPKGCFEISPVRSATLFQLFAEQLIGVGRVFGVRPRWYIMTSPANHDVTEAFFTEHKFFGLPDEEVIFFPQGQMPAFMPDGKIAMIEKHRVALGPDGHGGSLNALAKSGALDDMRERGIEHISYFQVDNPLVRALDPLFIGLHIDTNSEMSSKAVAKAHDLERVGVFCNADGKTCVIEYSDMPEELAVSKNADGTRRFDAGSIAVHILAREFVERLTADGSDVQLPWHRAVKKVPIIAPAVAGSTSARPGQVQTPEEPNVVKLEAFVFDAIPLARNPLVLFTPRGEEFSPVKNADGADSPATTRRDMLLRAARWLEQCGCTIPRNEDGLPDFPLEISPAFAIDAEDLGRRLVAPPELKPGQEFLLS